MILGMITSIADVKLHRNIGIYLYQSRYGGLRQWKQLERKVSEADSLIANVELRVYVL